MPRPTRPAPRPTFGMKAKRYAKGRAKALKRRYFKGTGYGNPRIMNMAKDIKMLKDMVNTEKHSIIREGTPASFAQLASASSGGTASGLFTGAYVSKNIVGHIEQGTGEGQRIGDLVKMQSFHIDLRIINTAVNLQDANVKVMLVRIPNGGEQLRADNESPVGATEEELLLHKLLKPSVFDNTYDSNSSRNYQHMREFQILATRKLYFPAQENVSMKKTYNFSFGGKLLDHVRWDKSSTTGNPKTEHNQYAIIALADDGERGVTTPTWSIEWSGNFYYVDN